MTPSPVSLIAESSGAEHHIADYGIHFYVGVVIAAIFLFIFLARRGFNEKVFKNTYSQLAEQIYIFIEGLAVGVIGAHGKRYIPFLFTLWLFIFMSNIIGLALPHTPTASWSWNIGLALTVFIYVQIEGARANGIFGHIGHFLGPKLVDFKKIATWPFLVITSLVFGVEILGEFIKILSLSLRLYGNINGGHMVKASLDGLFEGIPIGAVVMPLEILVSIIQALVFTLLTAIYLSLVTGHHEEHEEDQGNEPAEATA